MKTRHIPDEEYLRKKMGEAPNAPTQPVKGRPVRTAFDRVNPGMPPAIQLGPTRRLIPGKR